MSFEESQADAPCSRRTNSSWADESVRYTHGTRRHPRNVAAAMGICKILRKSRDGIQYREQSDEIGPLSGVYETSRYAAFVNHM